MTILIPIRFPRETWESIRNVLDRSLSSNKAEAVESQLMSYKPSIGDYIDAINAHCGIKQIARPLLGSIGESPVEWFIHGRDGLYYAINADMHLYKNSTQNPGTWQRIMIDDLPTDNTQEMGITRDELIATTRGNRNEE